MKTNLVYGLIFGTTFILVTVLIIFFNSIYTDIFKFDFTPVEPEQTISQQNSLITMAGFEKNYGEKIRKELLDSLRAYQSQSVNNDSNSVTAILDSTIIDSLAVIHQKLAELEKRNKAFLEQKQEVAKVDSVISEEDAKKFEEWAKQTAKLYESMDPKKAAKIIQNYSDNESREILFRMNKKKAAKILAELNPQLAQRITKAL